MENRFRNNLEQLKRAFPIRLESDVNLVLEVISLDNCKDGDLIHSSCVHIKLDDEELIIPYRVYFNEPSIEHENTLTEDQKAILSCIFLRHHDGYVRQNRLVKLKQNYQYWVTPFTFQLLGEYVKRILEIIDDQMNENILKNYNRFALENPKYFQLTESRMISYWNAYYRGSNSKLNDYIGAKVLAQIKGE